MTILRNSITFVQLAAISFAGFTATTEISAQSYLKYAINKSNYQSSKLRVSRTAPSRVKIKQGTYSKSIGNRYLGGRVYAKGQVKLDNSGTYPVASAELLLKGSILFLKRVADANVISAKVESKGRSGAAMNSGKFKVELAYKTLVNKTIKQTHTVRRLTRTLKLFPKDPKMKFPIGPVAITVKGNVGVGMSTGCTLTMSTRAAGARIDGDAKGWAYGKADAAAGVPGAKVGIEAVAKFANQHINLNAGANTKQGLTGSMTYTLQAISLKLKGFVKIFWKKWSKTLVEWKAGAYTRTLFRI